MEIKICGITNLEDALFVSSCGADAIGFIFYPKTPRYVAPETLRNIIKNLSGDIVKVGVFVNEDAGKINEIVRYCGLDMIQLHGDESPEYCRQFPHTALIKASSPQSEKDLNILRDYPVSAILIDTRDSERYGGTGKTSDWNLAVKAKDMHPLILSGGLNPDNILEAIETVSPHAVDVNSGVEDSPGKKNHEKVKNIIELVRNIKRKHSVTVFSVKK